MTAKLKTKVLPQLRMSEADYAYLRAAAERDGESIVSIVRRVIRQARENAEKQGRVRYGGGVDA